MGKQGNPEHLTLDPKVISLFAKRRFLLNMSEDDFRDRVLRPLLKRLGFRGGDDLCGPSEEGKDAVFSASNPLGKEHVYVLQSKRGNLNMSSKAADNVTNAATQCKTALQTKIRIPGESRKVLPDYVLLCASGKINKAARDYIIDDIKDTRIEFMDSDDLIHYVDDNYPELWFGIDADKLPYLRRIRDSMLHSHDTLLVPDNGDGPEPLAPVTDELFVSLYVHRIITKVIRKRGETRTEPKVDEIPLQGILDRTEKLVHLVGAPGAGKTTALQRLTFMLADKGLREVSTPLIPVMLKAKNVARSASELLRDVIDETLSLSSSGKPPFSDTDLSNGHVLVLIDALDEAPAGEWAAVLKKTLAFYLRYPECRVIITSRNYRSIFDEPDITSFTRYTLTALDLQQAAKILNRVKLGKPLAKSAAVEVLRQLQDVHGMELNPLLVTVFVASSDFSRRDIPANITELFKKYTELMLGRWDLKKGLGQQYQSELKDFLLRRLAFQMHRDGKTSIHIIGAKRSLQEALSNTGHEADYGVLWDEIVDRSGLLVVNEEQLSFRHSLLQEFFAGRGVPTPEFFRSVLADEWWKHPMIFYFGEHPDAHSVIEELMAQASMLDGPSLYHSAIAIGLCIQACYLSDVQAKVRSMHWTVESLAKAEVRFLQHLSDDTPELPLIEFLNYYMFARDSVAYEAFGGEAEAKAKELERETRDSGSDLKEFWYIVSLIQSGHIDKAELLAERFRPSDIRLLLAIHLGCFLVANLRIMSAADKKLAQRICGFLSPRIEPLANQVHREFKSLLLEVRKGQIKALPMPADGDSECQS